MEKFFRTYGIPVGLVFVKLLITLRTGIDTYNVSSDMLDVLVIDGSYLAMWMVAAYAGKGQGAMAVRPFAAAGAWILYLLMGYIAWQAGDLRGTGTDIAVSMIARVAGVVLLAYDTWDYLQSLVQQRKRDNAASWQDSLRSVVNALSYVLGALVLSPLVALVTTLRVGRDYYSDIRNAPLPTIIVEGRATPILDDGDTPQFDAPEAPKLDALDRQLLELYAGNPVLTLRDAGKKVGKSHTAVGNRLARLESAGVIYRNGNGVEVIDG